ncbi:MAG: hypothetical protein JWQ49_1379 [Edaphobacter sp.]|nr:hypothetical protein [Edaphobacter sp.]
MRSSRRLDCPPNLANADSQNGNNKKINPEAEENFSGPKSDREPTTIHHTSTTNSPAKNHIETAHFHKNPCKNAQNHPNIKILSRIDHTGRIQFHSLQFRDLKSPGVVAHNRSPAPMRQQFQAQPRLRTACPQSESQLAGLPPIARQAGQQQALPTR